MKKKKLISVVLAACIAVSLAAGCGKSETQSEPEQEQELTELERKALEDAIAYKEGKDLEEDEEKEDSGRPTHYDILPEVANATIPDGPIYQLGDIVLREDYSMTVDDVKEAVANSKTGAYCEERTNANGMVTVDIYDEYGLDVAAVLEWKYIDPSEDDALPVPEAGVYLSNIMPSTDNVEELWGLTDSVYMSGGYVLSNSLGDVLGSTKTHDDFIAELEGLGLSKVDELPYSITADEKGYYTDLGDLVKFLVTDSKWTGKTTKGGEVIVFTYIGEAYFKNENHTLSRISY